MLAMPFSCFVGVDEVDLTWLEIEAYGLYPQSPTKSVQSSQFSSKFC